jgi:parallel beta-helix repeat protein
MMAASPTLVEALTAMPNAPLAFRALVALLLAAPVVFAAPPASARGLFLSDWQDRYEAQSASGDAARCQLCHETANGGPSWNAYGWDMRLSLADPLCDLNRDGTVTTHEAFFCIELENSDGDGSAYDNASEIALSTQPGWTEGPFNTIFFRAGTLENQLPPTGIGAVDPEGTEPPPPPPPPPPGDDDGDLPPGQLKRDTIVVKPGQSIQAAIDRAEPGTRIYVLAGTYREFADETNGLTIAKNGIRLIGQSTKKKRVVLENAGLQRNGIVVVPPMATDCMSCHASMAPPFELLPGVEPGLPDPQPLLYDIEVRGITIKGFANNGLFTERVDGFRIVDVESIDNSSYGIFPTLSTNGIVSHSRATGSHDSGIWVETSTNVRVTHNLVEDNVNGFEISNSDDILIAHNEARGNSVGVASLLLPDIFDDRPGAKRIDIRDNHIHDNNRENTARPGSILASVPKGIGILHLGVDDSLLANNRIERNEFVGIGVVDYCLAVATSPEFSCFVDPTITPEFLLDSSATNNRVEGNILVDNGTNPPGGVFADFAADLSLLTIAPNGNCFEANVFDTYTSFLGLVPVPPACP